MKTFAERLTAALAARKTTVAEFSREHRFPPATIHRLAAGNRTNPSAGTLAGIGRALGLSPTELGRWLLECEWRGEK